MVKPFVHFGTSDVTMFVTSAGYAMRPERTNPANPYSTPRDGLARFPVFHEINATPLERAAIETFAAAGRCTIVPDHQVNYVKRSIVKIARGEP